MIFSESCGIDLGEKYVVIGGREAERKVISYKNNGFDRVLPDLQVGRYGHACAKFENADGKQVSMFDNFYNKVSPVNVECFSSPTRCSL